MVIYSPVDWYLDYFQFREIWIKPLLIAFWSLLLTYAFITPAQISRREIAWLNNRCLTAKEFNKVVVWFMAILEPGCSKLLPVVGIVSLFNFSHSPGSIVSLCGFNWFPWLLMMSTIFYMLPGSFYIYIIYNIINL